jgi:hypothetical protein
VIAEQILHGLPRTFDEYDEARTWVVARLDDNGNSFEIARDLTHAAALALVKQFEDLGHKQCYWTETA